MTSNNIGPKSPLQTAESIPFLRSLDLGKDTLQRLARIASVVGHKLAPPDRAPESMEPHSVERQHLEGSKAQKQAMLAFSRGVESLAEEIPVAKAASKGIDRVQIDHQITELDAFSIEANILFNDDPELCERLNAIIKKLYVDYLSLLESEADIRIEMELNDIAALKKEVGEVFVEFVKKKEEEVQVSTGLKIVSNLLHGFKRKQLFHGASNTHALLLDLEKAMKALTLSRERYIGSPALRREAYGHIKLLQERTKDLIAIEKAVKRTFPLSLFAKIKRIAIRHTYIEIKKMADEYYRELNFNDDEVEAFRDLSLEAHLPTRQHLIKYADDIFDGAAQLAEQKKLEGRKEIARQFALDRNPQIAANLNIAMRESSRKAVENIFDMLRKNAASKNLLEKMDEKLPEGLNKAEKLNPISKQINERNQEIARLLRQAPQLANQLEDIEGYFRLQMMWNGKKPDQNSDQIKVKINELKAAALDLSKDIGMDHLFDLMDEHLNLHAELDYIDKKTDPKEREQRSKTIREKISANVHAIQQIKDLALKKGIEIQPLMDAYERYDEKRWGNLKAEISQKGSPELRRNLEAAVAREIRIGKFEENITDLKKRALTDTNIGNKNPKEQLSLDTKEWKAQQEKAKEAIQGLFDELKEAYFAIDHQYDNAPPEDLAKAAAKELTQARNDLLNHRSRWDVPIERTLEIPTGPIAWARGQTGTMQVQHSITCMNAGYSSAAFRAREGGRDCIQPNLQRVEVAGASYTSSATTVEFMQKNQDKRITASRQQTAEILMGKIDHKIGKLTESDRAIADGTKEKPVTVDVMAVLLLSPDTLREWLINNPAVNDYVGSKHHTYYIDESQLERRMLLESADAWKAFSHPTVFEVGTKFDFKDKDGNLRQLVVEKNAQGQKVFALQNLDPNGVPKEAVYVQFDISCYNVGCNKWTQMMNYMRGKESSLEAIAANLIRKLRPLAKLFGKEMTEYSGGLGKELEDSMNAEAFAKDAKRYQVKIQHMKNQKVKLGARLRARNDGNLETIRDMNALIKKNIRPLRDEWLNAEREYHIAVKGKPQNIQELNMKRQEALGKWQEQRQGLALALDRALDKEDLSPDARQYLELVMHEEDLRDTFYEICDQFEFRDYRSPEGMKESMYTFSSALVAFGVELDADPHTACRSGKDRTSLQRMEVGTRFISREVYGRHLHYREREKMPEIARIREQMLLNSGQIDDLAALNTGSSGLNVAGSYGSFLKDFGNGGKVIAPWYENIVLQGSRYAFAMRLK